MLSDGTGGLVGQNEEASTCNNQRHGIGDDGVGRFGAESCAIRETMKNCIRAKNIAVRRVARMPRRRLLSFDANETKSTDNTLNNYRKL